MPGREDFARAERVDAGASGTMDPDLSAFFDRGGKLITYHGTTDGLIPYGNSVNYIESVVDELGQQAVRGSMRLYLVPGMDHCSGGEGAFMIDWLGTMETWVEDGDAPGALQAAHPPVVPGPPGMPPQRSTAFTRPVCAYPRVARYSGGGDDPASENSECVMP